MRPRLQQPWLSHNNGNPVAVPDRVAALPKGVHRIAPIGSCALLWLRKYFEEVRHKLTISLDEKALFLTRHGEGFQPDLLSRKVGPFIKMADLGRPRSSPLLCHTCATHMPEGGAMMER